MGNDTPDTEPPHEYLRCIWTDGHRRCMDKAVVEVGSRTRPFVCDRHEDSAATFISKAYFDRIREPLEHEVDSLRREWRALQEVLRNENSVVYYLQRENGDVKIGVSRRVETRMVALENEHGPLRLLALEYGGQTTERIRHKQFGHLRVGGEWFDADAELLDHCYRIVKSSPAFAPKTAPVASPPG